MITERDTAMYRSTFDDADTVEMPPLEVIALSPEQMRQCEAIAERRPALTDNGEPARIVGLTGASIEELHAALLESLATFNRIRDLSWPWVGSKVVNLNEINMLCRSEILRLEGR